MNKKTGNSITNKLLIPIILMMGFVPVIVHMYEYDPNLSQFDWFLDYVGQQIDFFLAWKMIAIIVVGLVMGGILLYWHFKKKEELKFENCLYLLFFYLLFVVMSALFSPHKFWLVRGTYELFEPVWVIFAYIMLCYYAYCFVREEKQVDIILRLSGIGIGIVTLIGVFQYFGLDFLRSGLGMHLMSNVDWWDKLDSITFNFEANRSYTTLYNPNFLSLYFGMLIPLFVCLFIGAQKIWKKGMLAIAIVLCLLCLKGSRSTSGWLALAMGAVILTLVLLSRRKKLFYGGIAVTAVGIVVAFVLGNTTTVGQNIRDTIIGTYHMDDKYALRDVHTGENDVTLNIRGNDLTVSCGVADDGQIEVHCKDADGNELTQSVVDEESMIYNIEDARFDDIQVQPVLYEETMLGVAVTIDDVAWNFVEKEEGGYYYLNPAGKMVKYEQTKQYHLFREDAMSFRGHIWNNTLPLVVKHIFVGSGANTYLLEYPQNDYIGQEYIYGQNTFHVKAHCWYLQQCVENGLLGTLALLGFFIWYIVQSIRIYRRVDLHQRISWVGFGFFAAVLVYLLAAIVNDSNVCTAPVFWGMLGLGLAVNRMITEKEKMFQEPTPAEEETLPPVLQTTGTSTNAKKKSGKKKSRRERKNSKVK